MDIVHVNANETQSDTHAQIIYTCERCGHQTNNKYSMIKHLNRKVTCPATFCDKPIEDLLVPYEKEYANSAVHCPWCQKKFNHSSNMYTHKKSCKSKPDNGTNGASSSAGQSSNTNPISTLTRDTPLTPSDTEGTSVVNVLNSILEELRNNKQTTVVYNNTTNNTNIQNNNNLQINVNSYGNESKDHISSQMMIEMLQNRDVLEFVKALHFNPEVPENHNVKRIRASKDYYKNTFLATYEQDGKWKHKGKEDVLRSVVNNGLKGMMAHMKELMASSQLSCTECFEMNKWFNECMMNPKQFMKNCFALTLEDEFVLTD